MNNKMAALTALADGFAESLDHDFAFWSSPAANKVRSMLYPLWKTANDTIDEQAGSTDNRLRELCEMLVTSIMETADNNMAQCFTDSGEYKSPSHRAAWNFEQGCKKIADDLDRILENER